jgi:hypothetical protein
MTPAAKSQARKAACREMAMEVNLLKRKQRTVVSEKQDLIKMHLLAEEVLTKRQKTELLETKKCISSLKDARVGAERREKREEAEVHAGPAQH